MSVRGLKVDLAQFAKKLDVNIEKVVKKVAFDAHEKFTDRTPVDTGRARASWDVTIGSAAPEVPPPGEYSEKKNVSGSLAAYNGSDSVFVTSALDYMAYLEDGSSDQAPLGIVAISIAEIEAEIASLDLS